MAHRGPGNGTARHRRAKEIFLAARERAPDRRARYLAEACGEDGLLREEVEALLEFDTDAGPLDGPVRSPPSRHGGRTTVGFVPPTSAPGSGRPESQLPPDLLQAAMSRLRTVGSLLPVALFFLWLVPVTVNGMLLQEFRRPMDWGPPVVAIVSSLAIVWLARRSADPHRALGLGLVYLVLVSYALATSQYWGAFTGMDPESLDFDVVGFSGVAIWMILYSVLVPTRPRRALPFLVLSATAPGVVYILLARSGNAPPLTGSRFFFAMVFPYLATVGVAYVAVRVVYQLGREVSEAREVGSYRLEEPIGQGGMGRVWRASHRLLARPAAVKLIRPDALGDDPRSVEAAIERFEREARTTASLRSQHTVELYDFGRARDGSLYYVMELLEGMDLDRMVNGFGPLEPARVVWLVRQACLSLAEAHERGLVHRDIKPANLFVCRQGLEFDVLKVLDFGLVRPLRALDAPAAPSRVIEGTPAFMPPEATRGAVDARADLYSLGCSMYWALTGRPVFEAGSVLRMGLAHATRTPLPPSDVVDGVPASLDAVVLRCLEKDREARFQTAFHVADALARVDVAPWTQEEAARWWKARPA